jgi:outer membrane protein insertion porin family
VDRANAPLDPTAGFVARTGVAWATPLLGSDVSFFRWTGDGASYREIGARSVLATALRVGNFFRTARVDQIDQFLPPDERFFAGGAGSVRGYTRNALGPGVYVTDAVLVNDGAVEPAGTPQFVPTGGTAVVVANAELRLPSPFWTELLRLVAFVDAGAVGTGALWDLGMSDWRVTPGFGMRLQTPAGPVRIDVGINPHDAPVAPLLHADLETGRVVRIADRYQADRPGLLGRARLHLGIGHAF